MESVGFQSLWAIVDGVVLFLEHQKIVVDIRLTFYLVVEYCLYEAFRYLDSHCGDLYSQGIRTDLKSFSRELGKEAMVALTVAQRLGSHLANQKVSCLSVSLPGLQARSPFGGVLEATSSLAHPQSYYSYFSPSLSPFLPLSLKMK